MITSVNTAQFCHLLIINMSNRSANRNTTIYSFICQKTLNHTTHHQDSSYLSCCVANRSDLKVCMTNKWIYGSTTWYLYWHLWYFYINWHVCCQDKTVLFVSYLKIIFVLSDCGLSCFKRLRQFSIVRVGLEM